MTHPLLQNAQAAAAAHMATDLRRHQDHHGGEIDEIVFRRSEFYAGCTGLDIGEVVDSDDMQANRSDNTPAVFSQFSGQAKLGRWTVPGASQHAQRDLRVEARPTPSGQ